MNYEISTDRTRFDLGMIHGFLADSYWARGIPRETVERAVQNSQCAGVFLDGQQVGFGRVITDYATIGYLADVFILPEHRGQGLARRLVQALLDHPDLQGLRRWLLATQDAHGLYEKLGFAPLAHPEHFLTIHHPDIYQPQQGY
jgi:GNAT superfamily N-acetyltransferase